MQIIQHLKVRQWKHIGTNKKKLNELKKYLNQPYPFYYNGQKLLQISCVIFFLALFFNYVIQPFEVNTNELKMSAFWVAFIHSLSPIVLLLLLSIIFTQAEVYTENWTLKYEFIFIIIFLFLTSIVQFLLRDIIYNNPSNWSLFYLKEELLNNFIIGSFLAFLVVSGNLNIQFYKNTEQASTFNLNLKVKKSEVINTEIFIETEAKSESFQLEIKNFVFAQSQGNYVELWIKNDHGTKPVLKRLKLKDLEHLLQAFSTIVRTHRSYLLNIDFIENVNGNAQGYKINLKNCNEVIPVSRNYLSEFNLKLQSK